MKHEYHKQDDLPDDPNTQVDPDSDETESQDAGESRRPWEEAELEDEENFPESDRGNRNFNTFRNPDEESIF